MYLFIAVGALFDLGVIVSALIKQLRANIYYEKLPDGIVPTESPPSIQSSTPQLQGQSEKENESVRRVLWYVNPSVM
jgi:hypothetical protein